MLSVALCLIVRRGSWANKKTLALPNRALADPGLVVFTTSPTFGPSRRARGKARSTFSPVRRETNSVSSTLKSQNSRELERIKSEGQNFEAAAGRRKSFGAFSL